MTSELAIPNTIARTAATPAPEAHGPPAIRQLTALQMGCGWFAENPGGLDRYYYELLAALPEAGVDCRGLVVGSASIGQSTGGVVRGFADKSDSMRRRLMQARRQMQSLRAERHFDLLVSHFALYTFPILDLISNLPFVVHFHGPWADESRVEGSSAAVCWAKRKIERAVYSRAQRLICLSNCFARILAERYRIPADRIRVIPGGVNVDRFCISESRTAAREMLGWDKSRPTVLCIRRLTRRMGLEILIDAAVELRKRVQDVHILIAGRGPIADELQQRIQRNSLEQTVKLLGFVPDSALPLAYRAADLTVVPSVALEGFGLVAAESLAAGTPPLVSPVGGLPEAVAELSSNLILAGADWSSLAEHLTGVLLGRIRLPDEASCAAFARRRYSWRVIAQGASCVYRDV